MVKPARQSDARPPAESQTAESVGRYRLRAALKSAQVTAPESPRDAPWSAGRAWVWAASDGVPDLVPDLFASGLEDNLAAPEIVVFKVEPRCDGGTRLAVTGSACPHHTVVSAEGIVDRQSRAELRDALLTTISTGREGMIGGRREGLVAVDLLRAVFADDWGWATLAEIHMRLSGQGRRLFVILDPHGDAHRHMERLGLDTLLSPLDSRRALNRLG